MTPYYIITSLCLTAMIIGLVSVFFGLLKKNREDKVNYLRDYKKGRIVLIYVCVFPLFWIGLIYSGQSILDGFINAIPLIMDSVVLKFNVGAVDALASANPLYNFAIYFSFALVCVNVVLFALSLVSQYLWNFTTNQRVKYSKNKLIIFGNNEQNHKIYASEKTRAKVIVDNISSDDALSLYIENIAYTKVNSTDNYITNLAGSQVKRQEKITVIINTKDDERNLEIARQFTREFSKLTPEKQVEVFDNVAVYLFGDPKFEAIYEEVVEDGKGVISYVNKYQKMAVNFASKYPYTRFMGAKHIDYTTSCVKNGVDINVVMLGFGRTNQQLFLTSVANNQFITHGADGVELKKVNYHLFDKCFVDEHTVDKCDCSVNDKNLNHNYFRYKNEFEHIAKEEDKRDDKDKKYLPLPSYPAGENFHHLDVNDHKFYNQIKAVLTKSSDDANFVIIAFGSDLENVDMAKKLVGKLKEWEVDNTTIFVKVRDNHHGQGIKDNEGYYIIACEDEVYDVENIIADDIFKMAGLRDAVYAIEYEVASDGKELTEERVDEIKKQAHRDWYQRKTQNERESNIYCALSLRSKLNMMGLDYCKVDEDGKALTEDEYLEIYAQNDMPDKSAYSVTADGKALIGYTLDFKDSRRKNMAIHEHYRWNSYMISKGTVPASKEQILTETVTMDDGTKKHTNGKNYTLRRHGNLTTFDGLVEFRKMVAERDKREDETLLQAEERKDVIKYDYQLLDDAHWLLTKTGHKIIKR